MSDKNAEVTKELESKLADMTIQVLEVVMEELNNGVQELKSLSHTKRTDSQEKIVAFAKAVDKIGYTTDYIATAMGNGFQAVLLNYVQRFGPEAALALNKDLEANMKPMEEKIKAIKYAANTLNELAKDAKPGFTGTIVN